MNGKGSLPRKYNKQKFDKNYDLIFLRKKLKERNRILRELKDGICKTPIEKLRLLFGFKE